MYTILNHTDDRITLQDMNDHQVNAINLLDAAEANPQEWVSLDGSRVSVTYQKNHGEVWIEDNWDCEDDLQFISLRQTPRKSNITPWIVNHLIKEENYG